MANQPQRPRVRIRFKYNVDTGEIEEFIVDDNAPDRSEAYHDKVARAFAEQLGRHPDIEDAGRIRHRGEAEVQPAAGKKDSKDDELEERLED